MSQKLGFRDISGGTADMWTMIQRGVTWLVPLEDCATPAAISDPLLLMIGWVSVVDHCRAIAYRQFLHVETVSAPAIIPVMHFRIDRTEVAADLGVHMASS
jgi:hypothetical protein